MSDMHHSRKLQPPTYYVHVVCKLLGQGRGQEQALGVVGEGAQVASVVPAHDQPLAGLDELAHNDEAHQQKQLHQVQVDLQHGGRGGGGAGQGGVWRG